MLRLTPRAQRHYLAATTRLLTHPPLDLANPPAAPMLVVTGEFDTYTSPGDCREVADALPAGLFLTVPGAGHLFHVEQPEFAMRLFERFLSGSDASMAGSPGEFFSIDADLQVRPTPGDDRDSRSCQRS